jgi:hypothetical protein
MGGIAIAVAIVVAMAMYLLDKHGLLKRALVVSLKVAGFAVLVALVVIGMIWGYQSWRASHPIKQAAQRGQQQSRSSDESAWQVVSESPGPNAAKTYTVSHAELARTKLFRGSTEEGRIALLRQTDSFFAAVDISAQRIIANRLGDETRTAPEFELPDDALCAFSAAYVREFNGKLVSACNYMLEPASCPTPPTATPPKGFTLEDDNKPCYTVRPTKTVPKQ